MVLLGASADQQTPQKCPRKTLRPRVAEASGAPRGPQGDGEAAHTGAESPRKAPSLPQGPGKKYKPEKSLTLPKV